MLSEIARYRKRNIECSLREKILKGGIHISRE
jgi:hypothetical protein